MMAKRIRLNWKYMAVFFLSLIVLAGCAPMATSLAISQGGKTPLNYKIVNAPYSTDIEQLVEQVKNGGTKTLLKGKDLYIAYSLGQRSSGGYQIVIDKVEKVNGKIVITYSEKKPKEMAISVLTYPTAVIKLPNNNLPVVIQKQN
jgi:hypothetical protein